MYIYVCVHVKLLQSYPILWDHMESRPPGSSVYGVLQAKIWRWLPCLPAGDLPDPEMETISLSSALAGEFFTTSATWEVPPSPYPAASLSLSLCLSRYVYICMYVCMYVYVYILGAI